MTFNNELTSSERVLRVLRHGVCLVENNDLEARFEDGARGGERVHLVADDADAAVVGGVQLKTNDHPPSTQCFCFKLRTVNHLLQEPLS